MRISATDECNERGCAAMKYAQVYDGLLILKNRNVADLTSSTLGNLEELGLITAITSEDWNRLNELVAEYDILLREAENLSVEYSRLQSLTVQYDTLQSVAREYDRLPSKLQSLIEECDKLQSKVQAIDRDIATISSERDQMLAVVNSLRHKLLSRKKIRGLKRTELDEIEANLQAKKTERESIEATLQVKGSERESIEVALQANRSERESIEVALQANRSERESIEAALQANRSERESINKKLYEITRAVEEVGAAEKSSVHDPRAFLEAHVWFENHSYRLTQLGERVLTTLREYSLYNNTEFEFNRTIVINNFDSLMRELFYIHRYIEESFVPLLPMIQKWADTMYVEPYRVGSVYRRFAFVSALPYLVKVLQDMPARKRVEIKRKVVGENVWVDQIEAHGSWRGETSGGSVTYAEDEVEITYKYESPIAEGAKMARIILKERNPELAEEITKAIAEFEAQLTETVWVTENRRCIHSDIRTDLSGGI
jgi:hypothetical protein